MSEFHIEIDFAQKQPSGQIVCGDVFISKLIKEDGRTVLVLSDGVGHGVKANVLATMTATMALNYTVLYKRPEAAARIIMQALPRDSSGVETYATFTIIELESDGMVRIVNYDNPKSVIVRNGVPFTPTKEYLLDITGIENVGKVLRCREFRAMKEDRIVFMSDGITQSGMENERMKMGWEQQNVEAYVVQQLARASDISARRLSKKILNKAIQNDGFHLRDDASCGVIYFRDPREMLLVTGPPFFKAKDHDFALRINDYKGVKIVCGGTTAEIIARELHQEIETEISLSTPYAIPRYLMSGFNLVTEGILTIGKVEELLENYDSEIRYGNSPAEEIVKQLMQHDRIVVLVGTRINWAHHDPDQPIEMEIRKFVVKRIVKLLEEKFFKEVVINFY
ncbi:MAG: serine/threonine-protein phosphatase [Prolixibacteraceae bacterium]|jgi:sulfur transfer complex TusBCD TusB component (DsrH family)|nr:serine/threonine-protein phosphatase [Prolixibacteraceae bacterium]